MYWLKQKINRGTLELDLESLERKLEFIDRALELDLESFEWTSLSSVTVVELTALESDLESLERKLEFIDRDLENSSVIETYTRRISTKSSKCSSEIT